MTHRLPLQFALILAFTLLTIAIVSTDNCNAGRHRFEPRYDKSQLSVEDLAACQKAADQITPDIYQRRGLFEHLVDVLPQKTYSCEVCVKCGKMIPAARTTGGE